LFKKEYLYVSLLIILVIAIAVFIGSRSPEIDTVYPEQRLKLEPQDNHVGSFAISYFSSDLIHRHLQYI
jgi:hypothetical protein